MEYSIAVMSSILQILPHPKFDINWTSGSKVIAKKLIFSQQKVNFLSITFEPVFQLISNFGYSKICRINDMFGKAVFLKIRWLGWKTNGLVGSETSVSNQTVNSWDFLKVPFHNCSCL